MFSKMALYTSSLYTLSTSPKIRVFLKNVWFMSLSPNQEFTCPSRFFYIFTTPKNVFNGFIFLLAKITFFSLQV